MRNSVLVGSRVAVGERGDCVVTQTVDRDRRDGDSMKFGSDLPNVMNTLAASFTGCGMSSDYGATHVTI